jgi:hypothetical protein
MKYRERDELVEGLRALADFIEAKGLDLPIEYPEVKLDIWIYDDYDVNAKPIEGTARAKLREVAKVLGKAEKGTVSEYFTLTKKFGEHVALEFTSPRSSICKQVVVGERIIPEMPARPARTEPVIDWICDDPILRG